MLLTVVVRSIIRPVVVKANNILRPHIHLKRKISVWIFRRFPETHYRLRRLIHQQALTTRGSSQSSLAAAAVSPIAKWSAVLSNRDLATLERPTDLDLKIASLKASSYDSDTLEPLVELSQMRQSAASICFVVPIRPMDHALLERTVQSVLRQTDPAWELLLCTPADCLTLAEDWLDVDWRIRRLVGPAEDSDIQQVFYAALHSTTTFVGLLSLGDVVDDDLVRRIAEASRKAPQADVIYTDEITQFDGGKLGPPFCKPDWSPEHQHSVNMLGRFVAVRKALLLDLPQPASGEPEAMEYAFNLSVTRRARQVAHIDDALYMRCSAPPARVGGFFSNEALPGARSVLEQHLRLENPDVRVTAQPEGSLHVQWPLAADVPVTLLILTGMHERELPGRGKVVLATNFVRSILERSSFDRYRIIVVDDGYVPDELRDLLQAHGHTTRTCPKMTPFSFARKANFASSLVSSGIIILLNDDLQVISPDWIQALASQAARPSIGAVGGKLLFADGLLQHAGIALGFHGSAGHMFHRTKANGDEYAGFASIERNYSAVTGAVLAYRKTVYDEVGGFDEQFQTDYNDIDFCLKCIARDYRIVYTPAATLYHFHNSSFKRMNDKESERQLFLTRWKHVVARDPYFSKHFQTRSHDVPLLIDRYDDQHLQRIAH